MTSVKITSQAWASGELMPGFRIPPISKFLDSRLESHDPAASVLRVSFATRAEYANPAGAVMGGIVAAFLDDVMGPVVVCATGGAKFPVTLDLVISYFKPVPIGPRAMVEARIDRLGGSAVFTTAVVLGENDEVLARAVQTAMLRNV